MNFESLDDIVVTAGVDNAVAGAVGHDEVGTSTTASSVSEYGEVGQFRGGFDTRAVAPAWLL